MKTESINQWVMLVANLGVVIGIILLIFELNQNQDMVEAEIRNAIAKDLSDALIVIALDEEMPEILIKDPSETPLTPVEKIKVQLLLGANFQRWENIHYQYRNGLYDEGEFIAAQKAWKLSLSSELAIETWCEDRDLYYEEFVKSVDNLMGEDICD
jgi:hypothetical protein